MYNQLLSYYEILSLLSELVHLCVATTAAHAFHQNNFIVVLVHEGREKLCRTKSDQLGENVYVGLNHKTTLDSILTELQLKHTHLRWSMFCLLLVQSRIYYARTH